MTKLEKILKRVRALHGDSERVSVATASGVEKMTSTQAFRYSELQELGSADATETPLPDQPWYSLAEAGSRLGCDTGTLLQLCLAGSLSCYIPSAGLRGVWTRNSAATPDVLALRSEDIAEIAAFGGVNLDELRHPQDTAVVFRLNARTYVDTAALHVPHPLPQVAIVSQAAR